MISDIIELIDKVLKTNSDQARNHRQTRILLIVLSLVLVQLSGCLPGPSSPLTQLESESPDFPLIHLDTNVCPSQRLYNYLIRASRGKIGPHADTDYIITRLDFDSDIEISFNKASYRLYCEVSDKYNKKVVRSFTSRLVEGRFEPVVINMGINSGPALVGMTRFTGTVGSRMTYTASGPVTNLAARIAGAAENGQILIGPETARRLNGKFDLKDLGVRRLKNVEGSVRLHSLVHDQWDDRTISKGEKRS